MENYKVTENDLVSQLTGFPIEVVQKMIERQVEQGNKADVTVFQKRRKSCDYTRGFDWSEAIEGDDFWRNVIEFKNFDLFFKKYPNKEVDTHVYYRGVSNRGEEIISELEKLGGKNDYGMYNGKDNEEYYFINPKDHLIRHISTEPKNFSEHLPLDFLKSFYTEKFLPEVQQEIIEIDGKKYNKQEILYRIKELKEVE